MTCINFIASVMLASLTLYMTGWFISATLDGIENSRAHYHQEIGK